MGADLLLVQVQALCFHLPAAAEKRSLRRKKKKWSFGGLFRRRKKEVGSESSSQEEEDEAPKKGFLARRRSRREKRKPRTNKSVGTFDHIVVNPLTQTLKPPIRSDTGSTIEEMNGCARDANGNNVMRGKDLQPVEDVNRREFHAGGSVDRLSSRSSRESFQRHARHDSSLSRNSSGGSGSLEQGTGTRRGRRAVKARAEALRDRQKAESSSEEGEVSANSPLARFKSDDTLSISLQREGSLNRRSRLARTERYIKRLSRDEESVLKREAAELEFQRQQRLCKSDAEGSFNKSLTSNKTVPGANRWVGPAVYNESSDLEHPKMFIRGSSATPSPGHSPLVRHKNILHYTNSAPACPPMDYDGIISTFPPGHSIHYATPVTTNSLDRKTPQYNNSRPHGPSPLTPSNRSAESIPTVGIPRARINDYRQNRPNYDYGTGGRSEREYVEFQQPGQRSLSYDSNIHCVLPNYSISASGPSPIPDPNDVMIVQFPVARLPPNIQQSRTGNMGTGFVAVKQGAPPPPPPRDPQRRIICSGSGQQDSMRPMSFACDNQHRFHPTDFLSSVETGNSSSTPFTIPALRHQPSTDIPVADAPLTSNSQRRSNSDNQLATLRYGHQSHISNPHSFNPIGRPRPSSVTPESMKPMTYQQQHIGHGNKYVIRTTPSPDTYTSSSNQSVNSGQLQFQYYADQQPRSRRPIHIQYNALTGTSNDQPYLSDSQVVLMKPPHQHQDKRHPMQHATEFWRQKDQEGSLKHKKVVPTSPRLQIRHINRSDRSRSNSPRPKELPTGLTPGTETGFRASKASKMRAPALSIPSVRPADSLSSLSGNSDVSSPLQISTSSKFSPDIGMVDSFESTNGTDSLRRKEIPNSHRPLSMVLENSETPEQVQNAEKLEKSPSESVVQTDLLQQQSPVTSKAAPPTPRRYSRQSSTSSLEAADWMSEDVGTSEDGRKKKRRSSNLEDALTELEAIYNSLKLGDEDLLDRAERRDLPIPHQKLNQIPINDNVQPLSSSWSTSRGAESDSGYNYSWGSSSFESLFDGGEPPPRRRAPSLRRSGIPDKVMDDMAYRRLHPKERPGSQDIRNVVSQSGSYLESSPAAAAADITPEELPQKPLYGPINQEPDVTLDDVVFRNIRHANNTLKILDPQPPFGIPIGPIAPAANSDYLHAVPGDTYRSMFKPRKVPDVVKDDLAYRNLRKDDKDPSFNLPPVTDDVGVLLTNAVPTVRTKNDNFSMRKRRAVRSLSANIQSLVNRESLSLASRDPDQDFEKAQSLSDLPDALQVAQKILEGKEVIGGGSIKIRNLTSGSSGLHSGIQETDPCPSESRRYCSSPGTSWVERANLTDLGDRSSFLASTSTETLTDSRANLLHQESVSNKRGSWQHKLRVFIPPPPNTTAEKDEADVSGDGSILQRPPPPPTLERNSSKQVTDNHQRPPPPPTPERSSSRRPSLDQSKIIASLVHVQSPVSVDRESPRQIQNISKPTPSLTSSEETHTVRAIVNSSDRRSARNSREIKIGKSSPLTDDSLPFPEAVPGSPLDEKQLEDLLSALAREARATSEKLEKELEVLGGDTSVQTVKPNQPISETHNKPKAKEQEAEQESNCTKKEFRQENLNISHYKENKKSSLNPKQKCGLETKLQVEEEKIKLQERTDSTQDKIIPQDDIASRGHSTQNTGSGNNEKKDINQKQTQEETSTQVHALNDKESVVVKLPSPECEPTANPVLVVEEECGSEDNVNSSCKSEHSNIDEDKLVSSSSSFGDNFVEKQSLGVHEDLPFIDSSDRKSMSKSPITVQITDIVDTEEPSSKCNVVTVAESDGAICNNDSRSEVVCRKSKIPVKVKRIEPNPFPNLQEPMESQDCVPCEVHGCSKRSEDKHCVEPAVSSVPMTKDIAAGGDVSSGSVVKEEGEELGASAPSTSSAAGGSSSGRIGSSGGCGECEGPCGDRQDHETPQHEAMYSDRRTKAFALEEAPTSGSSDGGPDTHRPSAERVARYKEERRRQLASQYGTREESGGAITPQRRYITRSVVKNGESGSSSNSEHLTSSATKVRTTRTSRLRAAVTSPTESSAQSGKDISGIPTRNGKDSGSASPRSALGKDSKEISSVSRSLFGKDLLKDSCLSPRKDNSFSITRSQSGKELLKDTPSRTGLSLSRSHSGKDLIKDMSLSPRPHSSKDSVHSKSQSGKNLKDEMGLSPRHSSGRDISGSSSRSPSGKELKDGGSPLRSLMSSSRTRRIGMTERRGLTPSTGSSDKEKSPGAVNTSDGISSSPRREKDKSSKRKSNLNRSLTTEEVVPVDTGEDNSAIRRRRRRGDHGVGSSGVSLSNLDGGPLHKSLLDSSLLSQSSTSPSNSSRSESSPLKASSDLQSPPSRALLRLTADSGTHFLQARRSARKTSPPVASPLKSSEREATPPPSKLKAAGTSLSVYSSTVQQETPRSDKVSQRVERLMASARDAVARLNKLSGESSSISDGSDNRQPLTHHESGLGGCSSALIDTTVQKTVNKSDMNRSTELTIKKTFSPSPDDDDLQIPMNSSDSSPLENGSIEVPPRSRTNSPSKQPSSILKKKSLDEQFPIVASTSGHQMPISILKRKTSQDEAGSGGGGCSAPPPPVTFSPSVLEQAENNSKRQGILKKRCSLDESEVLRRRSCSPDMAGWASGFSSGFRPILKNQRRSSMEELVRRTFSPDPQPQSILKRRTSRDDEVDERTNGSPEPQGILKRKSGTSSNSSSSSTSPHVSIAASVIKNVVGLDPTSDLSIDSSSEQVRPILKKKSSSEDNTAADSSSTEAPRPILKKKASVDVDDLEDKPMKPILKSSRKSSQEDQTSWESASSMESPVRCLILRNRSAGGSDSASGSDCELVRPILKQPSSERSSRERSSSPRHRLSFCDDQDSNKDARRDSFGSAPGSSIPSDESRNGSPSREGVILRRRLKQSSAVKSNSTSAMDNELCAILSKRRSLEVSADVESDTVQLRRSRSPIVMETSRGQPRPMSVAERIMNMESFLVQEDNTKSTGAVPKRPGSLRASRDRERFHTQPITLHELHASSRLESVKAFREGILDKKSSANSSLDTVSPIAPNVSPIELPANDCNSPVFPSKEKHDTSPVRDVPGVSVNSSSQPSSLKKEPVFTMSNEVGSHGDDGTKGPQPTDEDPEGLLRLCKSNSVVAKASLFAQLEEDMKRAAEEASLRKLPKGTSRGVARYKARREQSSQGVNRFSTQPVTMVEVQEAVRSASSESTISDGKQKSDEDDEPSQLSLAERVKLFNQKIQDDAKAPVVTKQPPPTRKRLGPLSRFKTQPVTNEEVETAAQRISPLAASLAKPPDPKLLGGMSAKAAREKMYEHASAVLTKSSSSSRIVSEKERTTTEKNEDFETDIKPKGILKNLREIESRTCRSLSLSEAAVSSDVDTESESEVKGILKSSSTPTTSGAGTPELESFRHLKSVLKKEIASSVNDSPALEDPLVTATNDHLRSILKPESKEWDESPSSSSSESSSETDLPTRPFSAPSRNTLDLISILHGVEANARKERQALVSSPNNKPQRPNSTEEKIMNLRNLRNEKENHQEIKDATHFERRKIDKDSKITTENHNVKTADLYLDHKSLVKQRKMESKLLVEELNRKSFETHHVQVSEKNHTLNSKRLLDSPIMDHKSLVNQKKLESKKLVEELTGSRKLTQTKKLHDEEETSMYERQLRRQIEELQRLSSSPNDTPTPPTSDGETSSSGGREVRRIIRNEAVARRRQAALARQQREANSNRSELQNQQLKKSQSHSSVSSSSDTQPQTCSANVDDEGFVRGGLRRSYTQPLTDQELRDADDNDAMSGASIAERLAALQKSGNTDWRKRVSKLNPEDDLTIICNEDQINTHHHLTQESRISSENEKVVKVTEETGSSVSILADRLGKLDAATQGWKKRVGPTDAVQFSVAGRMLMEHTRNTSKAICTGDVTLSPIAPGSPPSQLLRQPSTERKRRAPRAERFRSKAALQKEVASTPSSPQKEIPISFKRSISAPGGEDETDLSVERYEALCGPKVAVPRLDDETFTSFFSSSISTSSKSQSTERLDICLEDLDQIVSHSSKLSVQKRTVRVQRKAASSRNPIKALAARTDLQDEYVEVRTGVAEKELKRMKVEKLAKHSTLAVEALAGLASREDFTAVALKKAASPSNGNMLPYKDLMLLQVKGRRHVQTRLVEPVASSINSGDNYVLVTPTEVYNYVGRYSNVIERSRGAEVASNIQQKKDLGYSNSRQVITISEEKATCTLSQVENFWKLLGSTEKHAAGAGHPDEDELFESAIIATNMVYEVQDDELVPMTDYWGAIPKIEMLDPSKILVFDFGSEMYVWNGKNAPLDRRRVAQSLARELWAEGFDYSECDVCPITAAAVLGSHNDTVVESRGPARPEWSLLAKVIQHMETVLFREKFLDWPDFSRVIRTKGGDDDEKQVDASIDVKPCDIKLMLEHNIVEPDLELEGSHVGRGSHYYDEESHQHHEIKTLGVTVWHILEYEHTQLPETSVGHFHKGDSYVVRWLYNITVTGRELSGQPSRHSMLGRDRCAYFCWQGSEASLNEQGAAALLTVELDRERGPQVRVVEGIESPAFLSLFKGHMMVHAGKREDDDSEQKDGTWRLYISRGELQEEGVLVEVPCSVRQLRSRASLVLLNTTRGVIFVWHGAKTQPHTRKIAIAAAQQLKTGRPVEVGFCEGVDIIINELHEGEENSKFFRGLGGANRHLYVSLLDNPRPFNKSPRLFHLSSLSGTFCSTEMLGPYRNNESVTAFPFLQSDLYSASQPALFLCDNNAGNELWLWQGWWPDYQGEDTDGCDARGSAAVRWQAERRAAMQTALDYWCSQHQDCEPPVAYLVWAGLEPLHFTNLFPIWTDRDDIAELNIRDGRKPGEILKVEEELARLTRSTYPVAQLLQRPLPDGVDPTHLELYLSPQHFQELLGMSKEEFLELPTWKQTKIKKEVGLF